MEKKLYLWKVKVRGHWLWCHASSGAEAMEKWIAETGEPLDEYCLEWKAPTHLDGSKLTPVECDEIYGAEGLGLDNCQ